MTTPPSCPPQRSPASSQPSLPFSRPCAASWSRSEAQATLRALRAAQGLAARLVTTEAQRPSEVLALRVQVVTEEAISEWTRLYTAVVGLLEAETLD